MNIHPLILMVSLIISSNDIFNAPNLAEHSKLPSLDSYTSSYVCLKLVLSFLILAYNLSDTHASISVFLST